MNSAVDMVEAARQLVASTREAQGLPERIADPAVLARLAILLRNAGDPR